MKNVHLIGVAGVGMRALAQILLQQGFKVSGSDIKSSTNIKHLVEQGLVFCLGHDAKNVLSADIVVRSSAIKENHEEWLNAKKLGKTLQHRSDMLCLALAGKKIIAVTGAHGKTSTTSMIAHVLSVQGLKPSFAIGSSWGKYLCGANYDSGDWAVVEADESDGSFLRANHDVGVVLNIESEHMENYQYSIHKLYDAYNKFMLESRELLVCPFDNNISHGNKVTFGFEVGASVKVEDHGLSEWQELSLTDSKQQYFGSVAVYGRHQLSNLAAAYLACKHVGVSANEFLSAMKSFQLPGRRFESLGHVPGMINSVVIDDYGHHPTEIMASVKALRLKYKNQKIIHVFQPHKFSRLRDYFADFIAALALSDVIIIAEVYPAGEKPIIGYTGRDLFASINKKHVYYAKDLQKAYETVKAVLSNGDIVLCQGAGDITKLAHNLIGVTEDA